MRAETFALFAATYNSVRLVRPTKALVLRSVKALSSRRLCRQEKGLLQWLVSHERLLVVIMLQSSAPPHGVHCLCGVRNFIVQDFQLRQWREGACCQRRNVVVLNMPAKKRIIKRHMLPTPFLTARNVRHRYRQSRLEHKSDVQYAKPGQSHKDARLEGCQAVAVQVARRVKRQGELCECLVAAETGARETQSPSPKVTHFSPALDSSQCHQRRRGRKHARFER